MNDEELYKNVKALGALAHETRLGIVMALMKEGEQGLCPCHLIENLEMSNANLSFHLKELENAGLITKQKKGKYMHYSANCSFIKELGDFLIADCKKFNEIKGGCSC